MRGSELRNYSVNDIVTLLNGRTVPLCFCFESLALTEDIYANIFKCDGDIADIIENLANEGTAALLSLVLGAAKIADASLIIDKFMCEIAVGNKLQLLNTVINNLCRVFCDVSGGSREDEPDSNAGFQWDVYYCNALALGMSDAEFWAATPRKIWLLTRDKDAEARQKWLTDMYS